MTFRQKEKEATFHIRSKKHPLVKVRSCHKLYPRVRTRLSMLGAHIDLETWIRSPSHGCGPHGCFPHLVRTTKLVSPPSTCLWYRRSICSCPSCVHNATFHPRREAASKRKKKGITSGLPLTFTALPEYRYVAKKPVMTTYTGSNSHPRLTECTHRKLFTMTKNKLSLFVCLFVCLFDVVYS
jgi:hypothetical protein